MAIDPAVFLDPQAHGYRMVLVAKGIHPQSASEIIHTIIATQQSGAQGIWFGISSPGGEPGAARLVSDFVRSIAFPVIGHVHNAFSESASLAAAFPERSISPVGTIGFHQAAMNLSAGPYAEDKISDLLHQVRGHNSAMVTHLSVTLGIQHDTAKAWVYSGASFVGQQAADAGIVQHVCNAAVSRPAEYGFIQ